MTASAASMPEPGHPEPGTTSEPAVAGNQQSPSADAKPAKPNRVVLAAQNAVNKVRLWICSWLGLTYVLRQLNLRIGGNRADLERLAEAQKNNAEIMKRLIEQVNYTTRLTKAWEHGYPILAKIAAEQRAREAKAAKKVIGNGKVAGSIVGSDGKPLERDFREVLLDEVRKNFDQVVNHGSRAGLYLQEIEVEGDHLIGPDPDKVGGEITVQFQGHQLTVDDVKMIKAEQQRLLKERSEAQ